jgi:hypothetical protein
MNTQPEETKRVRRTEEQMNAYLDEKHPDRPVCCFCGNRCDCPYGNSPAPIANRGRCCGNCNQVVLFVRMGISPLKLAKLNKKNLKMLYDLVVKN